jgi:uncharacterized protein
MRCELVNVFSGLFPDLIFDRGALRMISSAPFMSCREVDFARTVIDSLRFATASDCIAGRLALVEMPRVADMLVRSDGWLDCELSGGHGSDADGRLQSSKSWLHLRVTGRLVLRCQRCLDEMAFDCAIDATLLLLPEGEAWPEGELEAEDYDAIPASRELSVRELVEEEVLLALPIVPRHAACENAAVTERESGASPFSALAGLKKH